MKGTVGGHGGTMYYPVRQQKLNFDTFHFSYKGRELKR